MHARKPRKRRLLPNPRALLLFCESPPITMHTTCAGEWNGAMKAGGVLGGLGRLGGTRGFRVNPSYLRGEVIDLLLQQRRPALGSLERQPQAALLVRCKLQDLGPAVILDLETLCTQNGRVRRVISVLLVLRLTR